MSFPDSGIKKIIIPKSKLPGFLVSGETNIYVLRYRFVSEDKNRTSHWSPVYKIIADSTPVEILNTMVIDKTNKVVNISWQPQSNILEYHIYVNWNNGSESDWQYYAQTSQTNYSIVYGSDKTFLKVAVQVKTIPLTRVTGATLFENEGSLV